MTLRQKQSKFADMVAALIITARQLGYEVTFAEAYRPPETAKLYAEQGRGSASSLHTKRLAIDLNLFRDGRYLSNTKAHTPLGEYWESIGGTWGGRFERPDGNHYSLAHGRMK